MKDYILAHKWLSLADAHWDEPDDEMREKLISQIHYISTLMTREQIVAAQSLARAWKPTSSTPA
jgi:hypothetical protein